ncbi:BTAD domain-containing putative transcriptional regulator [Catenulispora pinisilvae]|uniref:BTAD domain-containing putative transcriptional regulator n=1 Tax=Catenulispora pinisilvae TaxID=2705253 RepID=UPI0018925277|nr:BTAD domain-containing putative transcriptional regulator [Catenulispora pinisilvae]
MRTLTRAVRGLLALALLVAVVCGIPWFLAESLGVPFPRPLPTSLNQVAPWLAVWRIDRARFVLDLLGIVGWCYWAAFIRQLVVQVPSALADAVAIARQTAPEIRDRQAGPAASLVAVLLTALAVSVLTSRTPVAAKTGFATLTKAAASSTAPAIPAEATATTAASTYTVVDGDTLWGIAAHYLGDAERWREIYKANDARVQADGQRLSDPNLVLPGWILELRASNATTEAPAAPPASTAPRPTDSTLPSIAFPQPTDPPGDFAAQPSPDSPTPTTPITSAAATNAHVGEVIAQPKAHRDRSFVNLPDGGVVGIGLAGALAAAIALARKRRRIRSTARWPIPLDTPQPAVPESAAEIERAHLATLAPPSLGYFQDGDLDPDDDDPYLSGLDGPERDRPDVLLPKQAVTTPEVRSRAGLTGPSIPASYAEFTAPGSLSFGTDGDHEIGLTLRDHAGLGLNGPGTLSTARALLVGILANGGPLASLDHMRVLIPSTDLATLLADEHSHVPRLEITTDLDDAVDMLEAEYQDRRRTVADLGVRTAVDVRRFYPEQTLEPLVLIATPEPAITPRLAALLEVGRTVDLHAVLLGPWDSGTTAEIGDDQRSHSADQHLDDMHAYSLSASEAQALLAQLDPALDLGQDTATDRPAETPAFQEAAIPAQTTAATTPPPVPRVHVNVLGPVAVTVDGHEVTLNNKETSILTFLALHPAGIARDEIIAALWTNPDGTNNGSAETFRSTVYHARTRIRAVTGESKTMYITNRGTRYLLDPADITTDLARFTKQLDTANRTRGETERITALEAAVDTYRGHLASGIHADWLIVDREAESRRFGDACARLAYLTADSRPEFALHVLERAVADADCNQELYAKIMRVQAHLGRHAEMWKTLRLLEVRLAVLDDEPDRNLYELADRLTNQRARQ